MRKVLLAFGLLVSWCLGGALHAAVPPTSNQADIAKAEDYLNGVTTLKARFMQVAPDGSTVEGTVYMSRPGRMRLEYDPPSPILVVANGTFLIYHDKQLEQTNYLDLDDTPAGILLQPQVKLNGDDLKVLRVSHQPGILDITVTKRNDSSDGKLTLVFTERPFELRQWQVVDKQGQLTTVSLFDAETGVKLDRSLFKFKDPKYGTMGYSLDNNN